MPKFRDPGRTTLSSGDTSRPQNQLLELLEPGVARDVALSVVAIGRDGGWLPRWALANSETNIRLYPTMSGGDFLALSSPQFASAVVRIGAYGARQGGTLTVTAPGASDAKRYVRSVSLGGRDVARTWLDWDQVAHGGKPAHRLSTEPSS